MFQISKDKDNTKHRCNDTYILVGLDSQKLSGYPDLPGPVGNGYCPLFIPPSILIMN